MHCHFFLVTQGFPVLYLYHIPVSYTHLLGIINNAPGTASPIPGLLAPFGFNPPLKVVAAIVLSAIGGSLAGFVGSIVFKGFAKTPADIKASEKATETIVPEVAIAAE